MRRRWRWALWALALAAVSPLALAFIATLSLSAPGLLTTRVIPAHAHFVGEYPPSLAAEVREVAQAAAALHGFLSKSGARPPVFGELGTFWMAAQTLDPIIQVMSVDGFDTRLSLMFTDMGEERVKVAELDALAEDVVGGLEDELGLNLCREDLDRGKCVRWERPRLKYEMDFDGALVEEPDRELHAVADRHGVRVSWMLNSRMEKIAREKGRFELRLNVNRRARYQGEYLLLLTNAPSGDQLSLSVFDNGGMSPEDLDALVRDVKGALERRYGRRFCRAHPDTGVCDAEHSEIERQREVWLDARSAGTASALAEFLAANPASPHAEAARQRLARLHAMAAPPPPAPPPPVKPWTGRSAGETFADVLGDGSVGPELTVVGTGLFHRGCVSGVGCGLDESPVHPVRIGRPFALSTREVTHAEFFHYARPDKRIEPWWANRPVTHLTWAEAGAYAAWLSASTGAAYRLPSEAEWEWAARAGTRTAYSWGDEAGSGRALCAGCWPFSKPEWVAAAGSYPANPWGFLDMHGNAAEWTADCWHPDHLGAPADGSVRPDGDCSRRVVRGGSYDTPPRAIRSAARTGRQADERYLDIGFRVLRELRNVKALTE